MRAQMLQTRPSCNVFFKRKKKCEYTKLYAADSQIKISSAVFGNFFSLLKFLQFAFKDI